LGGLRERKSMSQRRRGYTPRSKRTISFFWVSIRLLKVPYLSSQISNCGKMEPPTIRRFFCTSEEIISRNSYCDQSKENQWFCSFNLQISRVVFTWITRNFKQENLRSTGN
jgi:hypothetical protein